MRKQCDLCGDYEDVESENNFGFRYLCKDCNTFLYIRYNPVLYTLEEAEKLTNDILIKMKNDFRG